jgi:uncharacterized membrane protein
MLFDILIGAINIFGWGLKPLIEKKAIEHSSYLVFSNTRYITTAIISIFILALCKKKAISKHLNLKTMYYSIVVAIIGLVSIMSNYYLLSKYDANLVVGIVEPALVLVTLVLSYMFFNEKITIIRMIGIIIITIGMAVTIFFK